MNSCAASMEPTVAGKAHIDDGNLFIVLCSAVPRNSVGAFRGSIISCSECLRSCDLACTMELHQLTM